MIGTTIECLCCGARDGDANVSCNAQKYRSSTLTRVWFGPREEDSKEMYPLDSEAWMKSEDFKGYLIVPGDLPRLTDAHRQKIIRAVDAYAAMHGRVPIWVWPHTATDNMTGLGPHWVARSLPEELVDA